MTFKASIFRLLFLSVILTLPIRAAIADDRVVKLVGLGDSLMAGYQLPPEESLPQQLQSALDARGVRVEITNAGVSGDTSAGGLARVDWSVPDGTDGVILELGANDALRGIAPEETARNLEAVIMRLKGRGIEVLLVGMIAPPNMGDDYGQRFNGIFPELASKYDLSFYPFILDGVATHPDLQLEDGMHPNTKGVGVVAERMVPVATEFVAKILSKTK